MDRYRRSRFDLALDAISAIVDDGGPGATYFSKAEFGVRTAEWQKFAREHGADFQATFGKPELADDVQLRSVLDAIAALGFPIDRVRGWMACDWNGHPVFGYHTHVADRGVYQQYRFACTPLPAVYPQLVRDTILHLGGDRAAHHWYREPQRYTAIAEPEVRSAPKKAGLLGRSKLAKSMIGKLEPLIPKGRPRPLALTDDPQFGQAFLATAQRENRGNITRFDWALRGDWIVVYTQDGDTSMGDHSVKTRFLDQTARLSYLVQQTPHPR